jgi:hypothetical protein
MTRAPRRITFRIDRITTDARGIDREALERALHRELDRLVAREGAEALGRGGDRPEARAKLPAGNGGSLAHRIAVATVKALKS